MSFLVKSSSPKRDREWQQILQHAKPDIQVVTSEDSFSPADVRYMVTWDPDLDQIKGFPNLRYIFSEGAGVDQFLRLPLPSGVNIVRIIDTNLTTMMTHYVLWGALSLLREIPDYVNAQRQHEWRHQNNRLAKDTRIGMLGLGVLGRDALEKLHQLGFQCAGWSRNQHTIDGIECFHGDDGLTTLLGRSDILVCLLPLTPETRGILCAKTFAQLPKGASLINVGRGGHVVQEDLLSALDSGQIAHAILDVMTPEPLPAESPLWDHPGITLTPHMASNTTLSSAGQMIADNLGRIERGEAPHGLVDLTRGY